VATVMDLIRRGVLFNKKLQPVYKECTLYKMKYINILRILMQESYKSAIILHTILSQLFL